MDATACAAHLAATTMDVPPPVLYVVTTDTTEGRVRQHRMRERLDALSLAATFVESPGDCLQGHLEAFRLFSDHCRQEGSDDEADRVAVVMEDDVFLRRDLPELLPQVSASMDCLRLDLLLLGYLMPGPPHLHFGFEELEPLAEASVAPLAQRGFRFCRYPDDLWGTQMYAIRLRRADLLTRFCLDGRRRDYEELREADDRLPYFSADHIITKIESGRAMVYPMLAVEEPGYHEHSAQDAFHRHCHRINFDGHLHI